MARAQYRLPPDAQRQAKALASILAPLEPTPFAGESDAIAFLRAQRCLDGYRYARADMEARNIVSSALNLIGAKRPAWIDGQPVALPLAYRLCVECGAPLYSDATSHETACCSEACRRRRHLRRLKESNAPRNEARAARRAALACMFCHKPLHAKSAIAKFCDHTCRYKYLVRTAVEVRRCVYCTAEFRYAARRRPPKFCSKPCYTAWQRAQRGAGPGPLHAASAEARRGLLIR